MLYHYLVFNKKEETNKISFLAERRIKRKLKRNLKSIFKSLINVIKIR